MIKTVACIGAGIIGRSWSMVFARRAERVWIFDAQPEAAGAAMGKVEQAMETAASFGLINSVASVLERITIASSLEEAVEAADYVQENATENLASKRELFRSLDRLAPSHALLASSTSEFPGSTFMNELDGRHRCLVVHPLNPPHLIPAVEICPAPFTSEDTVTATVDFMQAVGQKPAVLSSEVKGFIMNRLQLAVLREALSLVDRGVCRVADLDITMKYGLGLRWATMGPFETNFLSTAKGYSYFLNAYGDTLGSIMDDLATDYVGDRALGELIDNELAANFVGADHNSIEAKRDRNLSRILAAKLES